MTEEHCVLVEFEEDALEARRHVHIQAEDKDQVRGAISQWATDRYIKRLRFNVSWCKETESDGPTIDAEQMNSSAFFGDLYLYKDFNQWEQAAVRGGYRDE